MSVMFTDGYCPKCGEMTHGHNSKPLTCLKCGWQEDPEKSAKRMKFMEQSVKVFFEKVKDDIAQSEAPSFREVQGRVADDVVKALRALAEQLDRKDRFADGDTCTCAADLIESRVATERWIPVEERLPEDGNPVIVYSLLDGETAMARYHRGRSRWEEWGIDDMDQMAWLRVNGVTHWRPLPEPPKGADR